MTDEHRGTEADAVRPLLPASDDEIRHAAGPTASDSAATNEPVPDMTLGADVAAGEQDLVSAPGVVRSPEHDDDADAHAEDFPPPAV